MRSAALFDVFENARISRMKETLVGKWCKKEDSCLGFISFGLFYRGNETKQPDENYLEEL